MTEAVHTLTVPSSTGRLEEVRRFVETHAQAAHLSKEAVEEVRVAVDEACTNVIRHAYEGRTGEEIDVAVLIDPECFTIRIRDRGRSFDPERYREPDLAELTQRRRGGGLGVHLMRQLMDEVQYQTHGSVNEVRLVKCRNGRD